MRKPNEVTQVGTIISEIAAFDNPFFKVVERVIKTPDGKTREPQLLWDRSGKTFVIAAAITESGMFVFAREPKYGQMDFFLTLATGGVKKETLLAAAQRELLAETGYSAREEDWLPLITDSADALIDFADKVDGAPHFLFVAQNAKKIGDPEHEVVLLSKQELETMLHHSQESQHKLRIALSRSAAEIVLANWDSLAK